MQFTEYSRPTLLFRFGTLSVKADGVPASRAGPTLPSANFSGQSSRLRRPKETGNPPGGPSSNFHDFGALSFTISVTSTFPRILPVLGR